MGYRSEVAVAIKAEYYTTLIEGVPANTSVIRDLISQAEVYKKDDGILIHWQDVKWYYTNVEKFEFSLKEIDSEHWCFIEIGEDIADNKMDGHWYDNPFNLGINRSIHMET